MAFSRTTAHAETPTPEELTARMVGIGMHFAAEPRPQADIEIDFIIGKGTQGSWQGSRYLTQAPHFYNRFGFCR